MLTRRVLFFSLLGVLLSASAILATGSNDSPSGATVVSVDAVSEGDVSYPYDQVDWYTVFVPGPGYLVVFLDSYQEHDVDLFFYDAAQNLLAQSTSRGEDEVAYGRVAGGTYYIKIKAVFTGSYAVDYDLGVLYESDTSGYLRTQGDIDLQSVYLSSSRTYWIFLADNDGFFDPDLFLIMGDSILDTSRQTGNLDVVKWSPSVSGNYGVAVGSAQGSGYYYLLVGSKAR